MRHTLPRRLVLAGALAIALPHRAFAQGPAADLVIVVPANSPLHSLDALATAARRSPNSLLYATGTPAGAEQAAAWLQRQGLALVHIPYRGPRPALADLLDGHTQLAVVSVSQAQEYGARLRTLGRLSESAPQGTPGAPAAPPPVQPAAGNSV